MSADKEEWVALELPDNFEEMAAAMGSSTEESIGWCLMCSQPIRTEADLIPETSTHNCAAGRALEEKIKNQS